MPHVSMPLDSSLQGMGQFSKKSCMCTITSGTILACKPPFSKYMAYEPEFLYNKAILNLEFNANILVSSTTLTSCAHMPYSAMSYPPEQGDLNQNRRTNLGLAEAKKKQQSCYLENNKYIKNSNSQKYLK